MIKNKITTNGVEFLKFAIVGIIATIINLTVYYTLTSFKINNSIAYSLGYIISLVFNYILTLCFTFKSNHNNKKGIKFISTHILNYFLQLLILNIFLLTPLKQLAPIITQFIYAPISFLLVKRVIKN